MVLITPSRFGGCMVICRCGCNWQDGNRMLNVDITCVEHCTGALQAFCVKIALVVCNFSSLALCFCGILRLAKFPTLHVENLRGLNAPSPTVPVAGNRWWNQIWFAFVECWDMPNFQHRMLGICRFELSYNFGYWERTSVVGRYCLLLLNVRTC